MPPIPKRRPKRPEESRLPAGCPDIVRAPAPFASNDAILESAVAMFRGRSEAKDRRGADSESDPAKAEWLMNAVRRTNRHWHRCMKLTPGSVPLSGLVVKHHLSGLEAEVLMALLLDPLALWDCRVCDVGDILRVLSLPAPKSLGALRALSENGRLHRKGLLHYCDPDEDLRDRCLTVDPEIVQMVVHCKESGKSPYKREEDLQDLLGRIARSMQNKSGALDYIMRGRGEPAAFQKWRRLQTRLLEQLGEALRAHPDWTLTRAKKEVKDPDSWAILLALAGKVLGHVSAYDTLFTGAGLARVLCAQPEQFARQLGHLMCSGPLVRENYVQPCGGDTDLLSDNAESVQAAEFELTEKALGLLGLDKARRLDRKRDAVLREPRVRLADLALPAATAETVAMALGHVRNAHKLMNQWGLRGAFPYGTGVTMLFHGPPGTGKTATAEAVAHELGKPLLVADYSKIQNCFVGQTEKNITAIFRNAVQHSAVLFWDEADAMFFDRDSASHAWEVRDVNVLLQQIERFEGVCILSTNRKATLDKALERRITAKVEFPRPDRALREIIWKKLLPKKLPVAKNVSLSELSAADLSGGEIKNVILNAARLACIRSEHGAVTAEDFQKALRMETGERWSGKSRHPVGFRAQ